MPDRSRIDLDQIQSAWQSDCSEESERVPWSSAVRYATWCAVIDETVAAIHQAVGRAEIALSSTHVTLQLIAEGKLKVILPARPPSDDIELLVPSPHSAAIPRFESLWTRLLKLAT